MLTSNIGSGVKTAMPPPPSGYLHLQLVILGAALGMGQWLEKKKVNWLGDAGVALLLGVLVGILSRIFTFSKTYISWMGFQVPPPIPAPLPTSADPTMSLLPLPLLPRGFGCNIPQFFVRNTGGK